MTSLTVNEFEVRLSNIDKVFWPEQGYTKGDLINYYAEIYPYIEDFLYERPLSLKIYPDGINGKYFFQKNIPDHAPHWLSGVPIYSKHRREPITWVVVNKLSDLIWVANSASIELHSWFSTVKNLQKPSFAVFDLDPGEKSTFRDVITVALLIKQVLDELSIQAFLKTSGKSGLHIYITLMERYTYEQAKNFLRSIAEMVIKLKPDLATIEWRKKEREGRVYIDYRQNGRGKTLPVPYSLRPTPAATVSAPLKWEELNHHIRPEDFTMESIFNRINRMGDLWAEIFEKPQELPYYLMR
ncbi:MAG: non-homologous end-joining DNA ligase [Halanaerobiales bacterium]